MGCCSKINYKKKDLKMNRYIALLHGVNANGKNKISMPTLERTFVEIGFLKVISYGNKGSVVFSSDIEDVFLLIEKCQECILQTFALHIPVIVISGEYLFCFG
jgi:uncharacterized protein (DUF1697 family)